MAEWDPARKKWDKEHPGERAAKARRYTLRRYGLTLAAYEEMLVGQGGGCAICGSPPPSGKSLAVDHDHASGKVRAILCDICNQTLGRVNENPYILRAMAEYLERHQPTD